MLPYAILSQNNDTIRDGLEHPEDSFWHSFFTFAEP